jgi:penicillin-binding protein 2
MQDQTEGAQSDRTVARDVSRRVVAYIGEHPNLFEGVTVEERTVRHYPRGHVCAHVVGYTGVVSRELLESSAASDDAGEVVYETGDTVGQAGVEYTYENVLQGIRGEQSVHVDANGNVLEQATSVEPQPGSDVVLTIDLTIQEAAENALAEVIELADHRWYIGTQYHPEYSSTVLNPHPLFMSFIEAAIAQRTQNTTKN